MRRIDNAGAISTVLGVGIAASSGDGEPSTLFPVDTPLGLGCDGLGNLFITSRITVRELPADASHHIDGSGSVLTIYGPVPLTGCLTGLAVTGPTSLRVTDACSGLVVDLTRATSP